MVGQNTHIVVVGGGMAGSSAALALHQAGFEVTVCEEHPRAAGDLGAFLTLASNGMRALAQTHLDLPVVAAGFELTEFSATAADGTPVLTRPLGESDDPRTRFRCLRWGTLVSLLQAEVARRGIRLRHGSSFVSMMMDARQVTSVFSDGTRLTADLVIGADGINSAVRRSIDPATPHYAGQRVFYGYTRALTPPTAPGRITMVRGDSVSSGYTVSPDGETFWFARQTAPAVPEPGPATAFVPELLAALAPDRTPMADLVTATDGILVTNSHDLPDVATWSKDRALLIGDAAHAASPATGQGAAMAFEDAVVLAKALRDSPSLPEALALYEAVRRPRTQRNMEASAAMAARRATHGGAADVEPQIDWDVPLTA